MIRVGQKLNIYVPKGTASKYADINNLSFEQKQKRIGKSVTRPDEITTEPIDDNYVYYKVRYGDTLWEIAKKYSGVSENDLMRLNNMNSGKTLKAGQYIKIKPKG
jgi:membrane-bound lytic murein transglycosylase D